MCEVDARVRPGGEQEYLAVAMSLDFSSKRISKAACGEKLPSSYELNESIDDGARVERAVDMR